MSNQFGNAPGNSLEANTTINLKSQETVTCETCAGKLFTQVFFIKRVNKLSIGSPEDMPAAIPVFKCSSCGEPLRQFIPKGAGVEEELFGGGEPTPPKSPILL